MNAVYEYLFTGIMLIVIFGASVEMVGIISVPMQGVSERQDLQATGEKVMVQVLSKGAPWSWGDTPRNGKANPDYFGLALKEGTTRQTYVLDSDKVQRLNPDDPYSLKAKDVQESLNLEKRFNFTLQVTPIFDVDITPNGVNDLFTVTVRWHDDGLPVPGANITAQIFYANVLPGPVVTFGNSTQLTAVTGIDGAISTLDFTSAGAGDLKILVVAVDHLGVKAQRIFSASSWQTVSAHQVGDDILVGSGYSALTNNPVLLEVLATRGAQPSPTQYSFVAVNTTLNYRGIVPAPKGSYGNYTITNPESAITSLFVVQKAGLYYLAFLPKEVNLSFGSSGSTTMFPPGVRLDRLVSIDYNLYYVRLYLWRLSQ